MARKRRTTPRAPSARRSPYHDDKTSQDINKAHTRIRDISQRLDVTVGRVDSHEVRLTGVETRQFEEREMIAQIRADLTSMKKENARTVGIVETTKTIAEKMAEALNKHIRIEAEDYSRQTKRIESQTRSIQSLARVMVWVAASFSGLMIVAAAIYVHLTGSSIMDLLPLIMGLVA